MLSGAVTLVSDRFLRCCGQRPSICNVYLWTSTSTGPAASLQFCGDALDTIEPDVAGGRAGGSLRYRNGADIVGISVSMYYKLRAQGRAPATLDVGRHKTIMAEADAAWVHERQVASLPGNAITNDEAVVQRRLRAGGRR